MQWEKLCKQNPNESPESLLEYVRLQAMLAGNTGTRGSSGTGSGGEQQQRSSVSVKTERVVISQKRRQGTGSTEEHICSKHVVRDNEEAVSLFEHMVKYPRSTWIKKLPGMNRAVLSSVDQLRTYKQRLGVEVEEDGELFGNDALRTKLLKSNGKYTVFSSRPELREYLCRQNHPLTTRFYQVFGNVDKVKNWFKKRRSEGDFQYCWPMWWP